MDDEIEYEEIIAQYEVKNPSIDNTILEGINDIDWSKLNGMGDEADIPALLRATLSDRIIIREKAFEFLMEHIEHQRLVFEVTYYVVPLLINMLLHKQSPDRALIIVALWSVARDCEDVAAGSDDYEVYKRVYEEISKGFTIPSPIQWRILVVSPDERSRMASVSVKTANKNERIYYIMDIVYLQYLVKFQR